MASLQNPDNGWGYSKYYPSNARDTILALQALKSRADNSTLNTITTGSQYLKNLQADDGSFTIPGENRTDYLLTASASEQLGGLSFIIVNDALIYSSDTYQAGLKSYRFLLENNASLDENPELAHFLASALYYDPSLQLREQLATKLIENQNTDGSWSFYGIDTGGAYVTARTLLALEGYLTSIQKNLTIDEIALQSQNGSAINYSSPVSAGELIQFSAKISNNANEGLQHIIATGRLLSGDETLAFLEPMLITELHENSNETYSANFSTDALYSGTTKLVVEVRDSEGRIITAKEISLQTPETRRVRMLNLEAFPVLADIKSNVSFSISIENVGNVKLKNLNLTISVLTQNRTSLWSSSLNASLDVREKGTFTVSDFYTDSLPYGPYLIEARVQDGGETLEGGRAFSSFNIGPRIAVERTISNTTFPPGNSSAEVNVSIEGKTGKPPADVVILVDSSNGSLQDLVDVKNALTSFVNSLREDDRVAVVAVADAPVLLQNLTYDRTSAIEAISSINIQSAELYLGQGINASVDHLLEFGRDERNWYIFSIVRNPSLDDATGVVERAASNGIPVYLITYVREGQ